MNKKAPTPTINLIDTGKSLARALIRIPAFRIQFLLLASWLMTYCEAYAVPNDHFTNAIVLSGNSFVFSGDLTTATLEPGESNTGCGYSGDKSAWWRWTATNSAAAIIMAPIPPAFLSLQLEVLTGSSISNLTSITCMRVDGMTNRYAAFVATSGTTYYFRALGNCPNFAMQLITTNAPMILATEGPPAVRSGAGALFGVVAAGIRPMTYQWQFRGNKLPGETTPTLLVQHLIDGLSDGYSVIVSNGTGVSTGTIAAPYVVTALQLKALRPGNPTNLDFELTAVPNKLYRIDSSTNLVDWRPGGFALSSNITTTFSIPRNSDSQFVRVYGSLEEEECISHLEQIYFAIRLWTIENQVNRTMLVSETDLIPYMRSLPICPSGGTTFNDSYFLITAADGPLCQRVPAFHLLAR